MTARLAGADGTQDGDGPGEALVYDAAHPERVMRASDWRDGRGGSPGVVFLVALGMLAAQVAVTVVLVRGRRARFGQLRPGIGIRLVSTRRVNGGISWRVDSVDGTATSYADSARLQAALRERVVAGYGTLVSDGARERLGVVPRTDGVDGVAGTALVNSGLTQPDPARPGLFRGAIVSCTTIGILKTMRRGARPTAPRSRFSRQSR